MSSPEETFGQYLVDLRKQKGVSRRRLHEMSGLSLSYLHEIETGAYLPGAENVEKIARALGVDETTLVRRRGAIEFQRLGVDPEISLLLQDLGTLTPNESRDLSRVARRLMDRRQS